jgi:hypothetical protein
MTSTFLVLLQRLHRSLTKCLYIMYKRGTFAKKEEKKIKTNTILLFWFLFDFRMYSMTHCILTLISVIYFVDVCKREILYIKMSYDVKLGARVAQWVRSLDLTTHTSLSPIRVGSRPDLQITKKGALDSQPQVIKITSCLPRVGGSLRVLRLPPPLQLVAMI